MCRGFIITWYNTEDESQVNSLFDKYKDYPAIDDHHEIHCVNDITNVDDYSIEIYSDLDIEFDDCYLMNTI